MLLDSTKELHSNISSTLMDKYKIVFDTVILGFHSKFNELSNKCNRRLDSIKKNFNSYNKEAFNLADKKANQILKIIA